MANALENTLAKVVLAELVNLAKGHKADLLKGFEAELSAGVAAAPALVSSVAKKWPVLAPFVPLALGALQTYAPAVEADATQEVGILFDHAITAAQGALAKL